MGQAGVGTGNEA